ncbi:hypothetical protein HPB51_025363 [Rhipicephalus microplus]|uniref:Tick transposon n=1 Tax=Rhipicephalus microplus TaxID=6941 RepID=A0A9J6E471_RHIMP|nr:hypothetical protein HPB51_025363 [Rhipicephalus microplus]
MVCAFEPLAFLQDLKRIWTNGGLTDVDRFAYVRSVLTGDLASTIARLSATTSCYLEALKILKQGFAETHAVIQAHMQRIIDMRPLQSSKELRGLQCLYDTVRSQTCVLKTLGVSKDSCSAMLYPILLKPLPCDIVLNFNKTIDH